VSTVNNDSTASRPRVIIVGGGFAGLWATRALGQAAVRITLIDRANHHLFQPLLYQVATAGLSPADIASPIRAILSSQRNANVLMAEVTGIDVEKRLVRTKLRTLPYDYLIVATGARHAYFGNDDWEAHAPGLKTIDDAIGIRRRMLTAFETAEASAPDRAPNLAFAIVGAGPTGVELAGAIAELAHRGLVRDFRHIDSSMARVLLIEAGPRVLPAFPEGLSAKAGRQLSGLGVEVRTGAAVTKCDANGVTLSNGERIETAATFWAAGVAASPAAKWFGVAADRAGRVKVEPTLTLAGRPEVFVIGDTASVQQPDGQSVPGVAPAAKQMGYFAARDTDGACRLDHGRAVPVCGLRQSRHHRPQGGCRRFRTATDQRLAGLAVVVVCPCLFPDRLSQPRRRHARLGLELFHFRARRAADHGRHVGSRSTPSIRQSRPLKGAPVFSRVH